MFLYISKTMTGFACK